MNIFSNIYKGKRVLVTGAAGFKGSYMSIWLNMLGAKVYGYSLLPETNPRLFDVANISSFLEDYALSDIRDRATLNQFVQKSNPEIIFHLAAQPIVRLSYEEPILTYETNVIGTLNLLEAARACQSVQAFVNVTSDKCYENLEQDEPYTEEDRMGGYDIYSSSKGCAEILTSSYRRSFLSDGKPFLLASGRAGNVIGGGDWALNRLLVDIALALSQNKDIILRSPKSTRPWQYVLEPLAGYLRLGEKLLSGDKSYAKGYNFGPDANGVKTVLEVTNMALYAWNKKGEKSKSNIIIDEAGANLHEAKLLQLDAHLAEKELGIKPIYNTEEAVMESIKWYKAFYLKSNEMKEYTIKQIERFCRRF